MPFPDISSFRDRSHEPAQMNQPEISAGEFQQVLKDIQWVNQHLNGCSAMIEGVSQIIQKYPSRSFHVLDLGTGSADIPIALFKWGQQEGIHFEITAIDKNPTAVAMAQEQIKDFPQIHVIQADMFSLDYYDEQFDIVICSLGMHLLETREAVMLLQEMNRLARVGFAVNDLERRPRAYWGIRILSKLMGMSTIFQHDAPLAVLQGFSLTEVKHLLGLAGLNSVTISRTKGERLLLLQQKFG